ncbi:MAG: hypothetical protein ACYTHK_02110 [Planctomycetota bacterium]|jgi:PAS domain-containing protein
MRVAAVCVLFVLYAVPAAAQESDPEKELLRAWFAIEDPEQRDQAERILRDLADREDLDGALRVRAEIGIARIEELKGRRKEARLRLEGLMPRTREDPALRRVVVERLGRPRWFHAVRLIQLHNNAPQFLDLDTGGLSRSSDPGPRGGPEMRAGTFLVKTEFDREFGEAVPPMSTRPWQRLRTDEGNLCWVQVLATSPQVVLRFITRAGGFGEILPAPRQPFCIGYNSKIEVWWHTDERYERYRVERRVGSAPAWQPVREFEKPPFIDRDVRAGVRYGYRITGVTGGEVHGVPVSLQGTVRSRGVTHGRVELKPGSTFDFLVGDSVAESWDIRIQNAWQQGTMIWSHLGFSVFALDLAPGVPEPRSPWDAKVRGNQQMKSGDVFLVPLRGGGVARCQISLKRTNRRNQWATILEYDAYADASVFPEPPEVVARETEEGVRIRAKVRPPFRLAEARVREVISRRGPWAIPLDENGEGLDANAGANDLREYSVVAVDAHGRRTLPGKALVIRMPDQPVTGEFKIRYQRGYSIEQRKEVPMGEADIFFHQQQRNIDRIYLHSNYGMTHVRGSLDWAAASVTEGQIYDRIAGADAESIGLTQGYLWINREQRGENVLILRTRHGGWAKLWLHKRDSSGSWTQRNAHFKFVYNPRSPTFEKGATDLTLKNGVRYADLAKIEEQARLRREWKLGWSKLWTDTAFRQRMRKIDAAGGSVADPKGTQEVLLEEQEHQSLETARYSFSLGRRDRPEGNLLNTVWDLRWRSVHLNTRLSPNDQSTLTDLGRMHWSRLRKPGQLVPHAASRAHVRYGHVYLHQKVMGNSIAATTLFRVIGLEPKKRLQIEWISLQGAELKTSPTLGLDAATRARLRKLLESVPKGAPAKAKLLGGEKAFDVFVGLHTKVLPSVAKREVRLAEFMPEFTTLSGFRFVLEGDIGTKKVDLLRPQGAAFELLSDIADRANLVWNIDAEGRIRLRPRILTAEEKREIAEMEKLREQRLAEEKKRREAEERKRRLAELQDVRDALQRAIEELQKR